MSFSFHTNGLRCHPFEHKYAIVMTASKEFEVNNCGILISWITRCWLTLFDKCFSQLPEISDPKRAEGGPWCYRLNYFSNTTIGSNQYRHLPKHTPAPSTIILASSHWMKKTVKARGGKCPPYQPNLSCLRNKNLTIIFSGALCYRSMYSKGLAIRPAGQEAKSIAGLESDPCHQREVEITWGMV